LIRKIAIKNIPTHTYAHRADLFIFGFFALLLALILFSLTLGRYPVPVKQIIHVILTTPLRAVFDYTDAHRVVVEIVRLPRILLVVLCGMGLALSGAAMQGVFRNPPAGP
jgi:iron complex transport system permease protein